MHNIALHLVYRFVPCFRSGASFPASFARFLRWFRRFLGFANDGMAWCWRYRRPACPSRRFSAGLGRCGGRANVTNTLRHRPPYLLGRYRSARRLPRSPLTDAQPTRHHKLVLDDGHNLRPALHLLGAAHPCGIPEQGLLGEPIAMFLPKPMGIQRCHVVQRRHIPATPPEPAFPWITFRIGGEAAGDPHDTEIDISRLADVQMVPDRHLDGAARRIGMGCGRVWGTMRRCIAALETRTIALGASRFTGARWRSPIQHLIAAGTDVLIHGQGCGGVQSRSPTIVAIQQDDGAHVE